MEVTRVTRVRIFENKQSQKVNARDLLLFFVDDALVKDLILWKFDKPE